MTALMWSAWGGDADSLVALLDAGATPDLRSEVFVLIGCQTHICDSVVELLCYGLSKDVNPML